MNWSSIFTAGLSSILGSLLTILATPSLQHYFWKHQQRAALKLKTIEAVNTLSAQFIQRWIEADGRKERYAPPLQWYEEFSAIEGPVKALFKAETYTAYKNLEKRVDPDLGTDIKNSLLNVDEFIKARHKCPVKYFAKVDKCLPCNHLAGFSVGNDLNCE